MLSLLRPCRCWCRLQPIDPELANYIHSLNPEATAEKLGNTLNLQEPCLRNLRIAETLLKEGVAAGLTLYDIAWYAKLCRVVSSCRRRILKSPARRNFWSPVPSHRPHQ